MVRCCVSLHFRLRRVVPGRFRL